MQMMKMDWGLPTSWDSDDTEECDDSLVWFLSSMIGCRQMAMEQEKRVMIRWSLKFDEVDYEDRLGRLGYNYKTCGMMILALRKRRMMRSLPKMTDLPGRPMKNLIKQWLCWLTFHTRSWSTGGKILKTGDRGQLNKEKESDNHKTKERIRKENTHNFLQQACWGNDSLSSLIYAGGWMVFTIVLRMIPCSLMTYRGRGPHLITAFSYNVAYFWFLMVSHGKILVNIHLIFLSGEEPSYGYLTKTAAYNANFIAFVLRY